MRKNINNKSKLENEISDALQKWCVAERYIIRPLESVPSYERTQEQKNHKHPQRMNLMKKNA